MSAPSWYAVSQPKDGGDDAVEIAIYDEIGLGGTGAKDFLAELKQHKGKAIALRINSVGGSVIEGAAIYNALQRHKGGLTVYVDGLAASMASVIAMAGDEVRIADNALMMIHNPWSIGIGDADALRKEADVLDKIKATIVRAYTRKTGMSRAEVSALMDAETWMDAAEAVANGFADSIEGKSSASASVSQEAAMARLAKFMAKHNPNITVSASGTSGIQDLPAVDTAEKAMNAELQAKVDELQAALAQAEEAKAAVAAESSQALAAHAAEVESLKGEVERLTAEVASKDEEINTLKAAAVSAGQQAAHIVASITGDPTAAAAAPAPELSAAEKFASLEGAEAVAFYKANKAAIIASCKS